MQGALLIAGGLVLAQILFTAFGWIGGLRLATTVATGDCRSPLRRMGGAHRFPGLPMRRRGGKLAWSPRQSSHAPLATSPRPAAPHRAAGG